MAIPKIINFCYFGGRPFSLVNYVAVKAAATANNTYKVYLNYTVKPSGQWFERATEFCELVQIESFDEAFGHKLTMIAHKADIWRLQKLLQTGGIYLDTDVICNRPFDPLLDRSVVMGQEIAHGKTVGLCSAAILAKPNANFIKRWWDGYDPDKSLWRGFRSQGQDLYWTEASIKYPYFLSNYWADEIDVIPFEKFYGFSWATEDLTKFYETNFEISESYVYHLWSNSAYDKYLKDVTEASLKSSDTNFSRLMLKYL